MPRPTANTVRAPKKIASYVAKALSSDGEVRVDDMDRSARGMLSKFARESGVVEVKSVIVLKKKVEKSPKKKKYLHSIWFALVFDYALIGYAAVMTWYFIL